MKMTNWIKSISFGLVMWLVLALIAGVGAGRTVAKQLFIITEGRDPSQYVYAFIAVVGMCLCVIWGLLHNRVQLLETRAALEEVISRLKGLEKSQQEKGNDSNE